jgi:16S rRNA (guanine527-N7)-methyltransferase
LALAFAFTPPTPSFWRSQNLRIGPCLCLYPTHTVILAQPESPYFARYSEGPLTPEEIAVLLQPYVVGAPEPAFGWPQLHSQLVIYLQLILKWNARTNLTAIRTPDEIVRRHFGESLFVSSHLGECPTLLDFGSGAGFPGIPIQLLRPDIQVTLAESQGKKASFLREAVRTLGLATEVWAGRVETMPESRRFHTVTLRAVDDMKIAVDEAARRASKRVAILGTSSQSSFPGIAEHFRMATHIQIPNSSDGVLLTANRI